MPIKKIITSLAIFTFFMALHSTAQEFNAKVIVNGQAVQNNTDVKIFKTLEQGLENFINTRKWSNDEFTSAEKIDCQINIAITKRAKEADCYEAKFTIQASRPVYGSDYLSPIMNYVDKDFAFKYIQFQTIDFNENRVAGLDPNAANITATVAYYLYYVLGVYYDSGKPKAGSEFYTKAYNVVNNAPESGIITGWKNEGSKNRYWLIDNMLNARFAPFRDVLYNYHRNGLDQIVSQSKEANEVMLSTIDALYQINTELPGSALMLLYFSTKNTEYYNALASSTKENRQKYVPLISMLDVANATKYGSLMNE